WPFTRTPPPPASAPQPPATPIPTPSFGRGGAARTRHRLSRHALSTLGRRLASPFGVLMLLWFVSNMGTNAVYNFFPLLMQDQYGLGPDRASIVMAVVTAATAVLFSPAGRLTARIGAGQAQMGGLLLRAAALAAMFALALATIPGRPWLAAVAFIV